jgi:hypothetical protein
LHQCYLTGSPDPIKAALTGGIRYMQLEGMTAIATPQIEEVAQLQLTPKAA